MSLDMMNKAKNVEEPQKGLTSSINDDIFPCLLNQAKYVQNEYVLLVQYYSLHYFLILDVVGDTEIQHNCLVLT